MEYHYSPYILPLLISATISVFVAIYIWPRRTSHASTALTLLALASAEWSLGYALEIAGVGQDVKLFWAKMQYFGITTVPLLWAIFALYHSGNEQWVTKRNLTIALLISVITVGLVFTTEQHKLVWTSFQVHQEGGFSYLDVTHGSWFWVYWVYSTLLLAISTFFFLLSIYKARNLFRGQRITLLIAVVAPWLGNLAYIFKFGPVPGMDLTPFGFTISVAATAWSILGFQLINIAPIARDSVIEGMSDGLIVLDAQDRITDINPAAERLFNLSADKVVGKNVLDALESWSHLVKRFINARDLLEEITVGEGENQHWYELHLEEIRNRMGTYVGRVVTLHNITERRQSEKIQQESVDRYRSLFENSPVSLWEEDYSAVKQRLDSLKEKGITDFDAYLKENPHIVAECAALVKVLDVNRPTLDLYQAGVKQELLQNLTVVFYDESYDFYRDELVFIAEGKTYFKREGLGQSLDGRRLNISISWSAVPGYEHDLSKVIVSVVDITEQRRAEERLRQLFHAVEASPASIIITDVQGHIQYVNPKFSEVTGYSTQEILGQHTRIFKSGKTPAEVYTDLWSALLTKREWHGEILNRRKNGELYWEFSSISPVVNPNGEVTNYVAVKEDVTERKRTDEALQLSYRQEQALSSLLRLGLESIPLDELLPAFLGEILSIPWISLTAKGGIFLTDEHTHTLILKAEHNLAPQIKNMCARVAFGRCLCGQAAASRKIQFSDCVDEHHEFTYEGMEDHGHYNIPILSGDEVLGVIVLYLPHGHERKEGEERFLQTAATTIAGIIERKRAEEALRLSEERYRHIYENVEDVLYETDFHGMLTSISPSIEAQSGYKPEELLGQNVMKFYHSIEDYEALAVDIEKNGAVQDFEVRLEQKGGRLIIVSVTAHIVFGADGVPIGTSGIMRDITKRKQAEDALASARDQALEASRLKSQFLAKMSHELRTPLAGILGYAELLHYDAFGILDEKQKDATSQIIESTQYLNNMVSELLDEAQIEANTFKLFMEPFSPSDLLEKVNTSMGLLASRKGLKLTAKIASNLPGTLIGDPQRLQQILINLVGNAVKFTNEGEIRIALFQQDPSHWVMQVSDSGIGIPQEAQSYIFEPFRQVHTELTGEKRGTGLGLSIVKQVVDLMNGHISLESELGQGSTFTITLPILENKESAT